MSSVEVFTEVPSVPKKPLWWNKKYGREALCAITKTRLRPGKNKKGLSYAIYLPCQHGFCRSALVKWVLQNKNTCPLCRAEFQEYKVFTQ